MYTVRIWNDVEKNNMVIMVFDCPRFTRRQYKMVLDELFYWACQGCENRSLVADVFEGKVDIECIHNERGVFSIYGETMVDGSTIDMYVHNNSEFYRKMNIAS